MAARVKVMRTRDTELNDHTCRTGQAATLAVILEW